MTTSTEQHVRPAYWSRAGLSEGVRLTLPLLPGTCVFAAAFGTIAAQKGLSLFETVFMSASVYAGASQLVALEAWPDRMTLAAAATIVLVTVTVNLRCVLMGAALRPWLGTLPASQSYPALFFVTDAGWLIGMRYRGDGGADAAVFVGSGLIMWASWVASTALGYALGALVAQPQRFGFDLVLPIFFAAMLVPLWRGPRRAVSWALAGAVALIVARLVPGWWFIVAGALAGSIAAGFIDERD
jgi:predicted branched-subunit amino acid permease